MKLEGGRTGWALQILFYALLVVYWSGATEHAARVNVDRDAVDQSAYMNYARKMSESHYAHVGDRNRMPVYPFLLSGLYAPGLGDAAFFERAKGFNILLSVAILVSLWWILARYLSAPRVLTLLGALAFTLYLFRAPYVQCEVLYFFLIFCAFLLMCRTIRRPGWLAAAAAGAVTALAHLTKASALPGFLIFLGIAAARSLLAPRAVDAGDDDGPGRPARTGRVVRILQVGVAAALFLGILYPYISTSKRVFGRWFYNVNSTFYIWYDARSEIFTGTRAHGDREGWPAMPEERIPGMARYLRSHSARQIAARLMEGARITHRNLARSYGFYKYLILYAGLALIAVAFNAREALAYLRENLFLAVFVASWLAGHALLYCWIAPINSGPRLPLQQVTVLMFVMAAVAFAPRLPRPELVLGQVRVGLRDIVNVAALAMLLVEVWFIRTERIVTLFSGA